MDHDLGESRNVAGSHPAEVKRLMTFVERARTDLGDTLTKRLEMGIFLKLFPFHCQSIIGLFRVPSAQAES